MKPIGKASGRPQEVRIIAGKHRGRKIPVADRAGLRPSPNRVRETLFNWLQFEISGMHILDAFAGTGALGLEALSRGAGSVLFMETNSETASAIQALLTVWHEPHARVQRSDAQTAKPTAAYDLIFIDPPFDLNIHQAMLDKFAAPAWLKPHGKIYLESRLPLENYQLPEGFAIYKSAKAASIHFGLIGKTA